MATETTVGRISQADEIFLEWLAYGGDTESARLPAATKSTRLIGATVFRISQMKTLGK
jgi:hypothetical protein